MNPLNKLDSPCSAPAGRSDEPLLFALLDGLGEGRVIDNDGGVSAVGRLGSFGLVGVVGAFVAEQVADDQDHDAQNAEDHHGDDSWQITDTVGYTQCECGGFMSYVRRFLLQLLDHLVPVLSC